MKTKLVEINGFKVEIKPTLFNHGGAGTDCFSRTELEVLQKAVCFNQGHFAQFMYLGAEHHKKMKNAHNEGRSDDALKEADKLRKFIGGAIYNAFSCHHDRLSDFFKLRSPRVLPRVCSKTTVQGKIEDFIREAPHGYSYEVEKNSGFHHVKTTGKFFSCNNIPAAAKKNDGDGYKNPRLDENKARDYRPHIQCRIWRKQHDAQWIHCWNEVTGQVDGKASKYTTTESSCYKSTLIIPLTFGGQKGLDLVFRERFNLDKDEKPVLGFLCFDHPDTLFFYEKDILVGYIFSDMLSLYILAKDIYMDNSNTFKAVNY